MHIVAYNKEYYKDFKSAAKSVDGLAVLGVVFIEDGTVDINSTMLNDMSNFLKYANMLQTAETTVSMPPFPVEVFTGLKDGLVKYYRYQGSLTTPPCTENVYWTVSAVPIPVHPDQVTNNPN